MWPRNFIYGLIDPRTLMIRYIGLSSTGVRRPRSHKRPSRQGTKNHCSNWIQDLIARGLLYSITVLEETERERLADAERWWIAYGRASGWPLTNMTDGGESIKHAAREKISAALVKREVSPETRAKMSAATKIRMNLPEYREAARTRALLQWGSPEGRRAASENFKSRSDRAAHLAKMNERAMAPDARKRSAEHSRIALQSPEYRAQASERARVRMADPIVRAKISAATKAVVALPEIRAKMRTRALGRKRSPATRAKISAALKERAAARQRATK